MTLPKLCCQVNVYVKCTVCKSQFCQECWKVDKSHLKKPVVHDSPMRCPATPYQVEWAPSDDIVLPYSLIPLRKYRDTPQ